MVNRDVTHITVSGALVNRISRAMNIVGWFPGLLLFVITGLVLIDWCIPPSQRRLFCQALLFIAC